MTNNSKVALGIIGAMAAGVVIGLLIAPEKGKDMRKRLKKNMDKWGDQVSHIFSKAGHDLKSEAREKVNQAKEAVG